MKSVEQLRELMLAAMEGATERDRTEIVSELIQNTFERYRDEGRVPQVLAAILDVQACVVLTVSHDGEALAEYALHKEATPAVADFVGSAMRSLSNAAESYPKEDDE